MNKPSVSGSDESINRTIGRDGLLYLARRGSFAAKILVSGRDIIVAIALFSTFRLSDSAAGGASARTEANPAGMRGRRTARRHLVQSGRNLQPK